LHKVVTALACEMLTLGGVARTAGVAEAMVQGALDEGRAAEFFQKMVRELGGPPDFVEHPTAHLLTAPVVKSAAPAATGVVASIDTRALGVAVVALGGGRTRAEHPIDHSVGLTELAGIGEEVGPNRPLCLVHARNENSAAAAMATVQAAYRLGEPPPDHRLIYERIGGENA
jgi:thymidine phosphorylase